MKNVSWQFRSLCTFAIVFFFVASGRASTIYDLAGQWSNTSNPNGPWTYREGTSALPLISNYDFGGTVSGFTAQAAWAPSNAGGSFLPVWLQSSQTGTPFGFETGAVLPGDVIVHSTDNFNGPGHGIANVIWTAPSAGTIDISGDIWWVRNISRVNDFSVSVGGTVISDGSISDGSSFTRSSPLAFSSGLLPGDSFTGIPVSAGEIVELAITNGTAAGEIDGIGLQINESTAVSAVPEPNYLWLVALVLALIGLRRLRWFARGSAKALFRI
jgi:hypothetical protein